MKHTERFFKSPAINPEKTEYIVIDSYPGYTIETFDGKSFSINLIIDDKLLTLAVLSEINLN